MEKREKAHTLSFWMRSILIILSCFFAVLLLAFVRLSMGNLLEQEIDNRKAILELDVKQVNESLEALEDYLYQEFTNQAEVVRIETGGDETELFWAKQELSRRLQKIMGWNESLRFLFFYAPASPEKTFLRISDTGGDLIRILEMQERVQEYIDDAVEEGKGPGKGCLFLQSRGDGYLIRFFKIRNSYVGMCLEGDSVLKPLEELTSPGECFAFLCDTDGNVISATDDFRSSIDIRENRVLFREGGEQYLQLSCLSGEKDFYIGTWTKTTVLSSQLSDSIRLLVIFAICAVLLTVGVTLMVRRALYQPILEMERGMKQVKKGEWELVVRENSRIVEYDSMIQNFNEMVSEIKNLKIQNYEKELSAQKTFLQYLQLQVNPHFYLNALNIIYSLAEVGNCGLIQEMTMSLVEYSRYMFREPGSLVTVQQEMEHVENYMKIQKMRFPDRLDFQPCMSSEIDDALIPPFIIQSFVENSIKYAVSFEQQNVLKIRGNLNEIEEELYVQIEIRDNGAGYTREVLDLISAKEDPVSKAGERVGIRNVKKRLELVFGDRAKLLLGNDGGAVTTILIPLMWQEDEADE